MASKTSRTETIRERKQQNRGKKRKAALRSKGTTRSEKELFGNELKGKTSAATGPA